MGGHRAAEQELPAVLDDYSAPDLAFCRVPGPVEERDPSHNPG